jgi:Flp pilus assembly protein TadD
MDTVKAAARGLKDAHKTFSLLTQWSTYLLFFLVPIFFLPWTSGILESNKQMLFVVLTAIGLLAWLGQMVISKNFVFKSGWLNVVPGVYFVSVLISSIFSIAGYQTWIGQSSQEYTSFLSITLFIVLFYMLMNKAGDMKMQRNILTALLVSSALLGLVTFLGMLDIVHLPFEFAQSNGFNTVGTVNGFLSYMSVMMFVGIAMWLVSAKGRDRVIPLGGFGNFMRGLIVLITAVNLVGLVVLDFWVFWVINIIGVLLLAAFVFIQSQEFPNPRRFAIPLVVLFISVVFLFLPSPFHLDLPVVVSPSYGTSIDITKTTLGVETSQLLFGSGPGTFLYDYLAYKPVDVNASAFWSLRFDRAKSSLITSVATLGLVGTVLWLVLMLWVAAKAIGRLVFERNHEEWKMTYVMFIGWALLFATHLLYSSNFTMSFMLWGFTGLLAAQVMLKPWQSDFSRSPKLGLGASVAFGVVAVGVLTSIFFTGSRFVAEVAFANSVELDQTEGAEIDDIISELNRAAAFNGFSDVYQRNLSSAYLMKARALVAGAQGSELSTEDTQKVAEVVKLAIDSASRATVIEPNYVSNWVVLGSIYRDVMSFASGAEDLAAKSFVNAITLEGVSPVHRTNLGRVYLTVADRARALTNADDQELALQAQAQEASLLATAEEAFVSAINLKGDYLPAHYYLAAAYERQGKLDQAAARLLALRNNNPTDIGIAFQLTQMLIRLEQYDTATTELERIVELSPDYSNAIWYLASMYEIAGESALAETLVERVVELNPRNEAAQRRLELIQSGESTASIPEPIQSGQSGATTVDEGEVVEDETE